MGAETEIKFRNNNVVGLHSLLKLLTHLLICTMSGIHTSEAGT